MSWATVRIENPGDVLLTVSLTLPFEDWKRLQDILAQVPSEHHKHPLWPVRDAISKAVGVVANKITEKVEVG